ALSQPHSAWDPLSWIQGGLLATPAQRIAPPHTHSAQDPSPGAAATSQPLTIPTAVETPRTRGAPYRPRPQAAAAPQPHFPGRVSGAHTWQRMVGCDILEDGSTRGYWQYAYDGRDFITFDLDTMTFTAADAAAQITKRKWEEDGSEAERQKHYLKNTCIEWLRKYVSYGQAVLERKEPPMVRVSGKEARGILTLYCRAYGFYPRPIGVSWLKDGEVRDQETERGGIAPNSDGTYYTWASIEALPEEKDKYRCRVEHASLPEPGLFAWETESNLFTIILAVAVAIVLVITIIAGFAFWKYKSGKVMGPARQRGAGGRQGLGGREGLRA
uniref:Ig-like domain-containing protein n=1 Tax=Buteo japonicus TaxID=224669 RepID=A0A8C0BVG5_9AVES